MADPTRDPSIQGKLHELAAYDSCSEFSRSYYAYIADLIRGDPPDATVAQLFRDFLDSSLQYHRRMQALGDKAEASLSSLQAIADKRRIAMEYFSELAGDVQTETDPQRAAALLLRAECHFHLRQPDRVVSELESAMAAGARGPLVCFALGYNRYALAVEAFLAPGDTPGEWLSLNPEAFRSACLDAVSAFELGLSGGPMDTQLYWWMAHVLEGAGLTDAAQHVREQAVEAAGGDALTEATSESDDGTYSPITEDEVRAADEFFRRTFAVEDLMG